MNTQQQIDNLKEKIKILEEKQKKELERLNKIPTIEINGYEYEIQTHDFNKKLSDIKIPKDWELWTYEDCIKLHNNPNFRKSLNLEDCWFFIEQPFMFNKENNYVARFLAYSGRACLSCDGSPADTDASLGVRFRKKISGRKK